MTSWQIGATALRALPAGELIALVAVPAYFFSFIALFCIKCLRHGMPRSARFDRMAQSRWLPRFWLEYGYWILHQQVRVFLALRMSANAVTILSLVLAAAGAVFIAQGRFGLGGWLMFVSFFCDAFDGIIARHTGTASARGEFFDSFIDRYADFVAGAGFLFYYRDRPLAWLAVCAMLVGSQAMGYARAKGEACGIDPNVGWMQRHERAVYLGIGTVLSPIATAFLEPGAARPMHWLSLAAITLVAALTNASAVWRAIYVLRRMPDAPGPTRFSLDIAPTPSAPASTITSAKGTEEENQPPQRTAGARP